MLFLNKRIKHDFLDTCARVTTGSLRLYTPEGEVFDFGEGAPSAEMQIHDWSVVTSIAARGDIGLGETYVAGLWDTPSIQTLTEVALRNLDQFRGYAYAGFWNSLKFRVVNHLMRVNSRRGAARNIRAHYDVGNNFYQLWLDEGMTYSSALFAHGDNDLSRAQNRKNERILEKIKEQETLLEIGCGWGGFAERAAENGHQVKGLTISPSQKGYADARVDGRAEICLQDYRESDGTFDAVVSIEMIEAVGTRYWPTYFATLKARMAEGGRALVQAITQIGDAMVDEDGRVNQNALKMRITDNYLEALKPGLLPDDPFSAAKAMELACHLKLDIELVARRCLPELLFNKPVSDETKKEVHRDLGKGSKAVERLIVCDPYIRGSEITVADFYAYYCLGLASQLAKIADVDLLGDSPKLVSLLERLGQHPSIAQVTAEAAG